MPSAIAPARGLLAEQVLLAILDAQPVGVADIRAALDELAEPSAGYSLNERLRRAAGEVLAAHYAVNAAYADDSADEPDYDRLWAAIEALGPILQELAHA